nr:UBN2 domain-containing protein [Ipomoea batatas]
MSSFIQSVDYALCLIVENGLHMPVKFVDGEEVTKKSSEFNDDDLKKMNFNAKAINIILSALGLDEYSRKMILQVPQGQASGKENANLCFRAVYRSRGNTCITGRTWLEINIASSSAFKVWNTLYVCENPAGCLFIATNRDAVEHLTELNNKSGQVLDVWLLQCVDQRNSKRAYCNWESINLHDGFFTTKPMRLTFPSKVKVIEVGRS